MAHFVRLTILICLALGALAPAATANSKVERQFQTWIQNEVWPKAKAQGISRKTFKAAFAGVKLNWKLPDLRRPGSSAGAPKIQRQAEFSSPARYFKEARLNNLVATGRKHLSKWSATLDAIEKQYGVPRRIIIAIWGRETAFGRAAIPHNAIRSLATQAFMGRRPGFFEPELLAALHILEQGHITPKRMKSSWAGAMGHPQFLPTKYLSYAVDFDGDGHRDIWNSVPDALASIAKFLKGSGWQPGRDWGFEATIPQNISCAMEGPEQGRKIADWVASGAKRVSGKPFPKAELKRTGFLLMPAGRAGPAYIATRNFYVLKAYNESDLYALFIGHVADRFGANRRFVGRWSRFSGFNRGDVYKMQKRLIAKGYDVGGADGLVGFKTRTAIGTWQERNGLKATCFPSAKLIRQIK